MCKKSGVARPSCLSAHDPSQRQTLDRTHAPYTPPGCRPRRNLEADLAGRAPGCSLLVGRVALDSTPSCLAVALATGREDW